MLPACSYYITQVCHDSSCTIGEFLLLPWRAELPGKWLYSLCATVTCWPLPTVCCREKAEHHSPAWSPESWTHLPSKHPRPNTQFWDSHTSELHTRGGPGFPFPCPLFSLLSYSACPWSLIWPPILPSSITIPLLETIRSLDPASRTPALQALARLPMVNFYVFF